MTWCIVGRSIARNFHLIDGDTLRNRVHLIVFNLSRRSRRVITVEIKSIENASDASNRDPTSGVSMRFITHSDVDSFRVSDHDPMATT